MNASITHKLVLTAAMIALGALAGCDDRTAEQKGKDLATEKLDVATGIGTALEQKGSTAGEAVVTGLGNVMKGMEKGVNKSGRKLVSDESVTKAGLKITKVQDAPSEPVEEGKKASGPALDVYIVGDADAEGKLRVIMYDVMDQEIGRASMQVSRKADEGKYQRIELDPQLERTAIARLNFDFKPSAVLAATK